MQIQKYKDKITELEKQLKYQSSISDSLENIVQLSVVGILVLDEKHRVIFVNTTACKMLDLSKKKTIGHLFGMPLIPDKFIEINFIREDDSFGKAEMQVKESKYLGQKVQIITLNDITDRKRLENYEIQLQLHDEKYCTSSEFLDITLEKVMMLTESKIGFLTLLDENHNLDNAPHICSKSAFEQCNIDRLAKPFHNTDIQGPWGKAVQSRTPVIINDFTISSPLKGGYPENHIPLIRFMNTPVLENNKVVALVGVANKKDPYDETDVQNINLLMKSALGIIDRMTAEEEKSILIANLNKRVKELRCLYTVTDLLSDKNIPTTKVLQKIVAQIQSSWQYPDITCARIKLNSSIAQTENFKKTRWSQTQDIMVHGKLSGTIEVFYLDEMSDDFEGPFMKEERALLNDIAERLGKRIQQKEIDRETKKLEIRLLQAQKMEAIGTLAGGIAHDFNNILSSILGFAEIELADVKKGSDTEDSLMEILNAGMRAKDLIKQILSFARRSDEEISPMRVDLIVKEVLKFIRASIPTNIEIKSNIMTKSAIVGNQTQVHQIFLNLFTNAAQAMGKKGGTLEVSLEDFQIDEETILGYQTLKPGNYVKSIVSDTGSGIPESIISSIFEPYVTTKDKDEGTGLGLAVVQGIVDSYNGVITVRSQEGKGSVFTTYLPASKKTANSNSLESGEMPTGKEHILIIDDEASIVKLNKRLLEGLGYQVTSQTSSIEAFELFKSKAFDLVITDITMPKLTGDELAVEMKKIKPQIPIILCTGYQKQITDYPDLKNNVEAVLKKPVIAFDIANAVRKILDESGKT